MAQAGQGSLKPLYIVLGIIVVVGAALIVRQMLGGSGPSHLTLAPAAGGPPLPVGPHGVVIGSDTAKVEVTEFADYECPFCARFAVVDFPDLERSLVETGKARWRFVHYPLFEIHKASPLAHLATACAAQQGKFWQLSQAVFNDQSDWVESSNPLGKIRPLAQSAGLDMQRYDDCVKNQSAWPQVQADRAFGDSLGINSTPTFMINGHLLSDIPSEDQLTKLVDSVNAAVRAPHGPAQPPSRTRRG